MSWLFGKNDQQAQETLGFDPAQVTDVASIINTPGIFDSARLHPLAGLDKGVEYLDLKDEQLNDIEGSKGLIPSRSWTDDLCYGTGAVYLLGLGLGGSYGFREGVANLPQGAPPKLQLNTILNHMTKRGPHAGNTAGVLALTYNLVDLSLDYARGVHDDWNSLAAGAIAGALFRSGKGLKPMAYSTALMTGAAGAWCGIKQLLK